MDLKNDSTFLVKMKSGYACLGDRQFLKGYCVLFSEPSVDQLNDLNIESRKDFMLDMSIIGDAITQVCSPVRINYGILGNSYPRLHAHIFPRYLSEPPELKKRNVWVYPERYWTDLSYKYDEEKHKDLKSDLIKAIKALI
jgi:diadenosine tetraphosphate (Ap4A) HIT family hydrolase